MAVQDTTPGQGSQQIFLARLVIGLVQGLILYLLYFAHDQKAWPATDPNLFAPLLLVFLFVPLLALQGLGNLRKRTLILWTVIAVAIAAGFAWYDVWHAWPTDLRWIDGKAVSVAHVTPTPRVLIFTAAFLFVSHALISCGEADRRILPRYPVLFDLAWKLGVQVGIAAAFVCAFWLILGLGVALFHMIKLDFFQEFIQHSWFAIPVTTLAAAVGVHVTDTRGTLVRGVRTLALMLLGWLLPVIALIAFAFLISLVFTGLNPLWQTRTATALLLAAAGVLVLHINAAYQDGNPQPHHVLRVAGTLASVLLIFIVAIAAYALWLRIDQYGWTVDRIDTAAVTLIAICFAIGYFVAALLPGKWLRLIETWNFFTTILGLIVLFALFTPIADPVRLSVASQMERLKSGKVKPENFDFSYLRTQGGRFGKEALTELAKSHDKTIGDAALGNLSDGHPFGYSLPQPLTPQRIVERIAVFPRGKTLPDSFLRQNWDAEKDEFMASNCARGGFERSYHCEAILRDFDGDGSDEVLLLLTAKNREGWFSGVLMKQVSGHWQTIATLSRTNCNGDREALENGGYALIQHPVLLKDIKIGSRWLPFEPVAPSNSCHIVPSSLLLEPRRL